MEEYIFPQNPFFCEESETLDKRGEKAMKKYKRKYQTNMLCITIDMKKTGENIKRHIDDSGFSIEEIMALTGVSTPQAVYKWTSGKGIPAIENLIALGMLFGVEATELIVLEGKDRSENPESIRILS